jgi:hypothetical protein
MKPEQKCFAPVRAGLFVLRMAALLALLPAALAAQDDLEPPPVDAAYQSILHEYTLHPDGATTYAYEEHLKFLTFFSFNRAYGESFIVYNPEWQTLKILRSSTTMANGEEVKAPFNAFNDVLPGSAANAAPYSQLREMVVTRTAIQRNAVSHLSYTITTKPGLLPGLMGKVLFGDRSPIEQLTVRVKVPKGVALEWCSLRDSLPPQRTEEGEWTVYTWVRRNLPLMSVETNQTPMDQFLPSLHFSTARMEDLAKHLLGDARLFTCSSVMESVAKRLVADTKSPYGQAQALRNYIEANVGLMSGDPAVTGWKPLPAEETFKHNVGSALDRTVLLAALCRAVGIDAGVALCHGAEMLSEHSRPAEVSSMSNARPSKAAHLLMLPDLASFAVFNTPVVYCPGIATDGKDLLLDPNSEQYGNRSARSDNKPFYVLATGKLTLPPPDDIRNRISIRNEWTLEEDGTVKGSTLCMSNGRARFSFRDDKERFVKGAKKSMSRVNGGMTVHDEHFKVIEDGTAQYDFKTETQHPVDPVGAVRTIRLPVAPGSLEEYHLVFPSYDRYTDYEMPPVTIEQCESFVKIPAGYTAAIALPMAEVSNLIGDVTCTAEIVGDKIHIHRQIIVYDHTPSAGHYHSARHLFNAWFHPSFSTITLIKK